MRQWRDVALALRDTNDRYKALLGLRTDPPIPMVAARVVTDSRGPFANARLADAGKEKGVIIGNPSLSTSRHNGVTGGTDAAGNSVGTTGDVNMFSDPVAVWSNLRNPILGLDGATGGAGRFRGMPFWNMDLQVKKNIHINERFSLEVQSIFTNVLNHNQLGDPSLDLSNPAAFGVLSSQVNAPRSIELGIRIRF